MPWLDVYGEGTLTLSTALIHITCRVIIHTQHWHKAIAVAISSTDIRRGRSNFADSKSDPSSTLADESTLLQGIIDPFDGVLLHGEKETAGHLVVRGTRVE